MEPTPSTTGHQPSPLADDSAVTPLILGGVLVTLAALGYLLVPSDPVEPDTARNVVITLRTVGAVGLALMFYAAVLVTAKVQESHQLLLDMRRRQDS